MKYIPSFIRVMFLALFLYLLINGNVFLWFVLFAVSLIVALFFGRLYCGYICPMNTLMIPIERLSKKLKMQTDEAPKWLLKGYYIWITLGLSIIIMILSKKFLQMSLPILHFWLIVALLVTLRYKSFVFHNLICPFGALQKTVSRFTKMSQKVDKDACIGCKLCEKACPSAAIIVSSEDNKALISAALCHQCASCRQVCPKNAIHYKKNK